MDTVVWFPRSGRQGPAAVGPDRGVIAFAIYVGSRVAEDSEVFVSLTGGESRDKVGVKVDGTRAALFPCPEGKGPPESAAASLRNGRKTEVDVY